MLIQSKPSKSAVLHSILANRFPNDFFSFRHFEGAELSEAKTYVKKKDLAGIICELKVFRIQELPLFDKILKEYRGIPLILILSPLSFQLLNQKRRRNLEKFLVILSDIKSLDFAMQLPRVMEEVERRKRLKHQNERLMRMVRKQMPMFESFAWSDHEAPAFFEDQEFQRQLLISQRSHSQHPSALSITLESWQHLGSKIGNFARNEIFDLIYRLIQSSVRNTDRVLRAHEDEILVFLSNADKSQVNKCKERLRRSLHSIQIQLDKRPMNLPFTIASLDASMG